MSLVQTIITENFVLVGADKRGIEESGNEMHENCNKLIKLNNQIIFGCTGGLLDNYKLFEEFCNYDDELGLIKSKSNFDLTYNDFIQIVESKFEDMLILHNRKGNNITYDINSVVSGYNGHEFEATCFTIGSEFGIPDGIVKVQKANNFPYKGVNAGRIEHMHNLHNLVQDTYFTTGKLTIRQCKNILYDVFEQGSKFDETINNKVCFEYIKKKDVIN